uniref:Uncharacterized protein n=1 Tax=Meloidogyne enterolobii TaxID=390850 RepID=A0A6V7VN46_MELEN|nr:unnamed protein product [Meloidogyne enterolobii]
MPNIKKSHSAWLREWISKFPDGIYTTDGKIIFCQPCNQQISCSQYAQLKQHSASSKHKINTEQQRKSKQQFLAEAFPNTSDADSFVEELCDSLIAANIPFLKINNPSLNHFLTKYCKRNIPDESTLRKNYLEICYKRTISRIKQKLGTGYVWCSVEKQLIAAAVMWQI